MIGPTKLCPEGIGLVLLDLDDTLMIDGKIINPRVLDAVNLARQRGCMVSVSSGRAIHMVPLILREPQNMDYLICANGAFVHDTFGSVLYERLMSRDHVLELMEALEPLGPGWNIFLDGISYFEWRCLSYFATGRRQPRDANATRQALHTGHLLRQMRKGWRFASRILLKREGMKQVRSIRPYLQEHQGGIAKVGCSLPSRDACERAIATLDHMGLFEVARMSATELEITAKGVTKGTAAQWLMDYLNISPTQTVAFGDSENDAPLADVCGIFVAMGNSDARVKDIADDVCESVYDDGVARWLERAMAEADGAAYE